MRTPKMIAALWIICFVGPVSCGSRNQGTFKEGDIVFQDMACAQSEAIKSATHSRFSHVGLILFKNGQPFVYEGVGPVKFTSLQDWIEQGEGSHYVVRRLKDADKVLTPEVLRKMEEVAKDLKGKAYDWTFEWSDNKIYCSELVWKIYKRSTGLEIGRLQKLKEFDFSEPDVQAQLKEKYGDQVPWQESVISPERMFESDQLITVLSQ
jgi:hypothetical protein